MKYVLSLTALAMASAAVIAIAAPEGAGKRHGEHMQRLQKADTDGNGLISRDEAKALPRIAKRFDEIDGNRDGQLSQDEMRGFHEKMHAQHEQKRAEHWKKIDANADGKVSLAEAQSGAPRMAEHFAKLDVNGDGFITPEEMKAVHGRHHKGQK